MLKTIHTREVFTDELRQSGRFTEEQRCFCDLPVVQYKLDNNKSFEANQLFPYSLSLNHAAFMQTVDYHDNLIAVKLSGYLIKF